MERALQARRARSPIKATVLLENIFCFDLERNDKFQIEIEEIRREGNDGLAISFAIFGSLEGYFIEWYWGGGASGWKSFKISRRPAQALIGGHIWDFKGSATTIQSFLPFLQIHSISPYLYCFGVQCDFSAIGVTGTQEEQAISRLIEYELLWRTCD